MIDYTNNIVSEKASILEALKQMNDIPDTLTLFVVDESHKMVGTLTDGDIRRGFINGNNLDDLVERFMLKSFQKIHKGFTTRDFKNAKNKGIRLLPVVDEKGHIQKVYDLNKRNSFLPLECMIMAGGRGQRLKPLTDKTPKPMLMLGNKPIIEHNIDKLISFGIEKIYISVRYLGEQIIDYLGNGKAKGITIEYIWEDEPLGTAGALSLVNGFKSSYILLMNSDLFTDANLEDLYLNTISQNAIMGVSTIPYTTKIPYGIFKTDDRKIISIKEKPVYTNYANAGIYVIENKIIERIPKKKFYNITDLIDVLLIERQLIIHNPIIGYWIDIGQHQDYLNAQELIKHITKGNIQLQF